MFCTNCGNNIPDGSTFCPVCGAAAQQPQQPQQPAYQQPVYQQPAYQQPAGADNSGTILAFGILSNALCWVPVLGLIFAILGMKKSGEFGRTHGSIYGKAKVGRILSIIGLVGSIIMTVYWVIVIIGAIAVASTPSYYRYYY